MKKYLAIILLLSVCKLGYSQFGYGSAVYIDMYSQYFNPTEDIHRSAGSAILNLGFGPKIWLGNKDLSISIEAIANLGFLGYSSKEKKGFGIVSFPIMAKLNLKGSSSFASKGNTGLFLGGGIQYNKTELYGLNQEHIDLGIKRSFFETYIGEVGYGFGINGAVISVFFRYGYHPDNTAKTYNTGFVMDLNFVTLKKIERPESKLF